MGISRQLIALVLTTKNNKTKHYITLDTKDKQKNCCSKQNKLSRGLVCHLWPPARKRSRPHSIGGHCVQNKADLSAERAREAQAPLRSWSETISLIVIDWKFQQLIECLQSLSNHLILTSYLHKTNNTCLMVENVWIFTASLYCMLHRGTFKDTDITKAKLKCCKTTKNRTR